MKKPTRSINDTGNYLTSTRDGEGKAVDPKNVKLKFKSEDPAVN